MFWLQENLILMKEMGNCPEFHRNEVTSYKIHTLDNSNFDKRCSDAHFLMFLFYQYRLYCFSIFLSTIFF